MYSIPIMRQAIASFVLLLSYCYFSLEGVFLLMSFALMFLVDNFSFWTTLDVRRWLIWTAWHWL
jgi:hypothetical protein